MSRRRMRRARPLTARVPLVELVMARIEPGHGAPLPVKRVAKRGSRVIRWFRATRYEPIKRLTIQTGLCHFHRPQGAEISRLSMPGGFSTSLHIPRQAWDRPVGMTKHSEFLAFWVALARATVHSGRWVSYLEGFAVEKISR